MQIITSVSGAPVMLKACSIGLTESLIRQANNLITVSLVFLDGSYPSKEISRRTKELHI